MASYAHPWLSQLHQRREASHRLPPLCCGCRDPWPCRCRDDNTPPNRWVDAGTEAAHYLIQLGYTPLLDTTVLRALWRRGGTDRQLAQHLYALAGG
jgi:hypothetical protein